MGQCGTKSDPSVAAGAPQAPTPAEVAVTDKRALSGASSRSTTLSRSNSQLSRSTSQQLSRSNSQLSRTTSGSSTTAPSRAATRALTTKEQAKPAALGAPVHVPILRIQKLAGVAPGNYYCVVNFGSLPFAEQQTTKVCPAIGGELDIKAIFRLEHCTDDSQFSIGLWRSKDPDHGHEDHLCGVVHSWVGSTNAKYPHFAVEQFVDTMGKKLREMIRFQILPSDLQLECPKIRIASVAGVPCGDYVVKAGIGSDLRATTVHTRKADVNVCNIRECLHNVPCTVNGVEISVHSLGIPIAKRMVPIVPKLGLDFCPIKLGNGVMVLMQIPKPPNRGNNPDSKTKARREHFGAPAESPENALTRQNCVREDPPSVCADAVFQKLLDSQNADKKPELGGEGRDTENHVPASGNAVSATPGASPSVEQVPRVAEIAQRESRNPPEVADPLAVELALEPEVQAENLSPEEPLLQPRTSFFSCSECDGNLCSPERFRNGREEGVWAHISRTRDPNIASQTDPGPLSELNLNYRPFRGSPKKVQKHVQMMPKAIEEVPSSGIRGNRWPATSAH